jgi:hypothetical protein
MRGFCKEADTEVQSLTLSEISRKFFRPGKINKEKKGRIS